ncbi:hypothetical protein [Mesorhizobium sp. CN2-181]|uniref:hypothetical protein n=1 Tax=Mesorhizobium yinganensis TaxID=3157707 RepID=UPI0032B824C5
MTQTLNGTAAADTLTGTDVGNPLNPDGIDIINGGAGDDTLSGLGGNDTIQGGAGADKMTGGAGIDTLTYANAGGGVQVALNATANGSDATGDTMSGFENLTGSAFNDQLVGDNGTNVVIGGGGNDYIQLSSGGDTLDGGAGSADIFDCRAWGSGLTINLAAGTVSGTAAGGTTVLNVEWTLGSGFNDIQTANQSINTILSGGGGNDTLNGLDANDQLFGDNFSGIGGNGTDTLNGGNGNDYLEGGRNADVLNGGAGTDTIGYADSSAAVTVNLATSTASGGDATGDTYTSIESVVGSNFNDVLTGGAGVNSLTGGNGDDLLDGGAGGDTLNGLVGNDTVTYAASNAAVSINLLTNVNTGGTAEGDSLAVENVIGSAFNDVLQGGAGNNVLTGGNGDDVFQGLGGADTFAGGAGIDRVSYSFSSAAVVVTVNGAASGGDAAGDTMSGIENLTGSAYNDTLTGDAGANLLSGSDGNDALQGRAGADTLQGGNGNGDTASYAASAASVVVTVNGAASGGDAAGDILSGIENLIGSAFADTLTGDAGANILAGGDGNDTLQGRAGADVLQGGNGVDIASYAASAAAVVVTVNGVGSGGDAAGDSLSGFENLTGSAFNDTLTGDAAANVLAGGDGNDTLQGRGGADALQGGNGADAASYATSSAGVNVSLSSNTATGGDAQGDSFNSIENIIGSAFVDTINGSAGANVLDGGAGDDILAGRGGADVLQGGSGSDTANYIASAAVTVNLLANTASGGDATGDTFTSIENVSGSNSADSLTGNAGANSLDGGAGNDVLQGGAAGDALIGGAGTDTASYAASAAGVTVSLSTFNATGGDAAGDTFSSIENLTGSAFADLLNGDAGVNVLIGGAGDDVLSGRGGADNLQGGTGTDKADYIASAAGVTVNLLANTATGGDAQGDTFSAVESVSGSNQADILTGNAGFNGLSGAGGDDLLDGGAGADALDGGAGIDTATYAASTAGVTVNLATGSGAGGYAQGDVLSTIEILVGSAFADTLTGGVGANVLNGGDGDDSLAGGAGGDVLQGGNGVDTATYAASAALVSVNLTANAAAGGDAQGDTFNSIENIVGSAFADVIVGNAAVNVLAGGEGNDSLQGAGGADVLQGGAGIDTASYSGSAALVSVNLTANAGTGGDAQGDTFNSIENVTGSAFADVLVGDGAANVLAGGDGDDVLAGLGGADLLQGGNGVDTATYAGSAVGIGLSLSSNKATGGDAEGDSFSSIENIVGSAFADTINGSAGANVLDGGNGDDVLAGRAGADTLIGGAGIDTATYIASTAGVAVNLAANTATGGDAEGDTFNGVESLSGSNHADALTGNTGINALDGAGGDDLLNGGAGADVLNGGAGIDTATYVNSAAGVNANLAAGSGAGGDAQGDTLAGIENLIGSNFADTLIGGAGVNVLAGGEGNDSLQGGGGADALQGGNGTDTASYAGSAALVSVNLAANAGAGGDAQGDTFTSIENVTGSAFADVLVGDGAANVLAGGDGDDVLAGLGGADLLQGGNGTDTASYAGSAVGIGLSLSSNKATGGDAEGDTFSSIENIVGSAFADTINGSAGANVLDGGNGDDVLAGRAGADTLMGGAGIDTATYIASTAGVAVSLAANAATGGDAQGDTFNGVENLSGSNHADSLTGDAGANTLDGAGGNDLLNGGAGADALQGGAGIDTATYATSAAGITVSLSTNTATGGDAQGDSLSGIENITGSAFADLINGDAGANALDGGDGNDVLSGRAGADALQGGNGSDTADYVASAAGVTIDLAAGTAAGGDAQGDSFSSIENLSGSNSADVLTGDAGANALNGAGGNDVLDGGAGADALQGGAGIDWARYSGSSASVVADLTSGTGTGGDAEGDTLAGIENLRGSSFADTLTGDAGANHLHDGGVGGADTLTGGAGSDIYSVYNAGATIVEIAGEGLDRVNAGVDFVLAGGLSIEYLNTTSLQSTYAVNLTGNELVQRVRGNDGANVLDGGGGDDWLFGMGGSDTFRFSTALGAGNVDHILDFSVADDQIALDAAIFSALGLGALDASAFKDNFLAPGDADDRIFYNSDTGSLFYDADGSGTDFAAVKFAVLTPGLSLSAADFVVI